ncbi:MAG TPA: class I SAM-dependent methyltransferase [Stellaceae bacterium]|nr:class I SAM-dependent methyltransferase [Stellaceae bacterium]
MKGNEAGGDWAEFYDATTDRPPRRTLLDALARFEESQARRFAVDLGSGEGRDAIELLRRGWTVLAIDSEPDAIERLMLRPDLPSGARLEARCERFEDASWPAADLVNASFALPLCPPERFPGLWSGIVASLRHGGRFAGQLYGNRDEWAGRPGMTHLSRAELDRLLAGLAVELLDEEETDSVTPRGKPKHWHIFHVVARKP